MFSMICELNNCTCQPCAVLWYVCQAYFYESIGLGKTCIYGNNYNPSYGSVQVTTLIKNIIPYSWKFSPISPSRFVGKNFVLQIFYPVLIIT